MTGSHLPALQVVIPLVAAPLCVLLRGPRSAWLIATVASWAAFAVAGSLLLQVLDTGVISYAMGGWAAPFGIEYRIDEVNAFVALIVSGASAWLLIFSRLSAPAEIPTDRIYLFYTAWVLNLTGLLGITVTGDAFNLFVFLEIASLSTYALVSFGTDRRALVAAYRYLVIGTIGATFILIGIGLLYMLTGTLNMADLADRVPVLAGNRTAQAAFGFFVVGVAVKMALFPIHGWLPGAYAFAPAVVSAFLAATATKVGIYIWLRIFFTIFGRDFSFEHMRLDVILMPLALAGVVIASVVAVFQTNLKRMLAFSSIAQIGYMALGISFVSVSGLTGAIVHLFNHALMKAGLFLALGCVIYRLGSAELGNMAGLGRRMPWTMAAFVVAAFSLVGVPLTAGFISKWYLIQAALEVDAWLIAAVIVAASLLALVYVWRVIEASYMRPETAHTASVKEAPLSMLLPLWFLICANIYFGIKTEITVGVAERAARALLG